MRDKLILWNREQKKFHLTASLVTRIMCDKVQIPPCAVSAPTQEDHEKRSQDRSTYYTTTEFDVYEAFVAIQTTG